MNVHIQLRLILNNPVQCFHVTARVCSSRYLLKTGDGRVKTDSIQIALRKRQLQRIEWRKWILQLAVLRDIRFKQIDLKVSVIFVFLNDENAFPSVRHRARRR